MILEDEPDAAVAEGRQLARRQRERVLAGQRHRARRRPVERAQDVKQRALAASRRPHDRRGVAGVHGKRDVLEDAKRARSGVVLPGDVIDVQHP
jgi:hypothetical protein